MKSIEEAMENYLEAIEAIYSEQTVETYRQGLQRFREFLVGTNHSPALEVSSLSATMAINFAGWISGKHNLSNKRLSKATVRVYLASVSRFFRYLLQQTLVPLSASDLFRIQESFHSQRHSDRQSLPKLPPEGAIIALLTAARQVQSHPNKPRLELARLRNIAILEALRSSGMSVGQLVRLRLADLDGHMRSAQIVGKRVNQHTVYFDNRAWKSIEEYLTARGDSGSGGDLQGLAVFARHDRGASHSVRPLTTEGVRLVFKQLARVSEIEIDITPQSLRHAFAVKMLETTGDLAIVQDMLGHSSPATTRIYTKVSNKKIREAHRAAFNYGGSESETKNK
jgi:site-specific recombinase XerD